MSEMNNLTQALGLIQEKQIGIAEGFGRMADSSKKWNIVSRILSGSGLWKLQNKIRAIGNVMNMYNENLNANREASRKLMDSQTKMGNVLDGLSKDIDKVNKGQGDLFQGAFEYEKLLTKNKGLEEHQIKAKAQVKVLAQLEDAQKALNETMQKEVDISELGRMGSFLKDKGLGKDKNVFAETGKKYGGMAKKAFSRSTYTDAFAKRQERREKRKEKTDMILSTKRQALGKALKSIGSGKFSQLIMVGAGFLAKATMGLALVAIVMGLLYRSWPTIKKALSSALPSFRKAFENIKGILMGVFELIKNLFQGNLKKALFDGLIPIIKNLLGLLKNILFGVGKVIVSLFMAGFKALWNKTIGGKFGIRKMARGGISSGGMTLVGEQGPELVTLPSGARVHSNQASRGMGGNVINVHVNGRVGASDSEIKDIANKVAREINLRMNRTGASAGRF